MKKIGWVDGRTQFYNGIEWKFVEDYIEGEEVLVYDKDKQETHLEVPVEYNHEFCNHFWKFWGNNFCECISANSDIDEESENSRSKCVNLVYLLRSKMYQKWYNSYHSTKNSWVLVSKRTLKDGKLDGEMVFEPYNPDNFREIIMKEGEKYNFVTSTGLFITRRGGKICISLGEKYAG